MKQSLQFKFSQQLSMTPQLQQAIKLLQLSTLELQQEVQQALDENPLLELEQHEAEGETSVAEDNWQDNWDAPRSASLGQASSSFDGEDAIYQGETQQSLHDHLIWQMQLSHFSATDHLIGMAIIDSIDDSGYLTCDLEDILQAVSQQTDELIELDEVAVVLKRIQNFDPIGVAARNVCECLLLQLKHLPEDTPWRAQAMTAVSEHLALLGSRDYRTLARKLRVSEAELGAIIELIQALQPRPGEGFGATDDDYVIPDVLVRKKNNRWMVELNPQSVPKLKVNESYMQLCQGARHSDDMQYIRQQTQEAKWFIRSL